MKQLYIFLILIILPIVLVSQNQPEFKHYTKKEGLAHTHVLTAFQDSKGFIWVGTYGGLQLFNGSTFHTFRSDISDSSAISHNATNVIYEDQKGMLWFGTNGGLNRYNRKTGIFTKYLPNKNANTISHQTIKAIVQDSSGNFWIGTYGGGLNKFDTLTNSFIRYTSESLGIPNNEFDKINTIIQNENGLLWIGTENGGIFIFDIEKEQVIKQFKSLGNKAKSIISSIYKDKGGNVWIGTWSEGLFFYDINAETFIPQICHTKNKQQSTENIRTISEDNFGNLWLAHFGEGLTKFNIKSKTFVNLYYEKEDANSISNNLVWSLLIDKNNILWVGTFGGGLNKYNLAKYDIPLYQVPEKLLDKNGNNGISTILEDHKGEIWLGTLGSKIFRFDLKSNTFIPFIFSKNTESNPIHHIYEDFQKQIWIGTDYELYKIDSARNKVVTYKNRAASISREPINYIFQDKQRNIWLGTNNAGLQMLKFNEHQYKQPENAHFITYKHKDIDTTTNSSNVINSICEDKDGNIWVGTLSYLEKLDIKTGVFKKILYQSIGSIAIDKDENIWVGTYGEGLFKLNKLGEILNAYPNIDAHNLNNKLNSTILGMATDSTSDIWLTTDNGISVYNKNDSIFKSYSLYDELKQNALWVNSIEKLSSGAIIAGGIDGFNIIWPDSLKRASEAREILFTDFKIANNSIVKDKTNDNNARISIPAYEVKELKLSYKDKLLLIEFIALEYNSPQNINYAYMLEEFDDDWIITNANMRYATYSNLNPGNYNFLVKATNNRGVWGKYPTTLKIIVTPPFWQTFWFRTLFIISILVSIALFIRFRTRNLKKQKEILQQLVHSQTAEIIRISNEANEANEEKLRFFTSVSHEFRTPLTLILGPVEHLKDKYASAKETNYYFSVIQKNAFRLLRLINEILDIRKIDTKNMKVHCNKGDVVDFVKKITGAFVESAGKQNVNIQFYSNIEAFETWFDPGKLEIIFYNLISNALHHTKAGGSVKVNIEIDSDENKMHFICDDSGTGIKAEQIDKIFDRFYQAELDKVTDNKGSGIGLSLTKEIIEILNGEISVESKPNIGTKFKLYLPIIKDANDTENSQIIFSNEIITEPAFGLVSQFIEEVDATNSENGKDQVLPILEHDKKLLLVEDDIDIRNYVKSCLNEFYQIIEAGNGEEALELAKEIQPCIIVSDIMMPIMDGIEFCSKVKEDLTISHIPIVLLSARSSLELQLEGFDTGADAFIPKPFSKKYLVARVNAIVNARETLRKNFINQMTIEPNKITVTSVDEEFIAQVKNIVEKNMDNSEFGVPELVEEIGISRSLLYTKFKTLTNCTTGEFLKTMRLKRACQLLEQNKHRVSDIAYMVGFNDPHSFSKTFKKQYGVTPSQYVSNNKL